MVSKGEVYKWVRRPRHTTIGYPSFTAVWPLPLDRVLTLAGYFQFSSGLSVGIKSHGMQCQTLSFNLKTSELFPKARRSSQSSSFALY